MSRYCHFALFFLVLLTGCSKKDFYRFGNPVGSFEDNQRVKKQADAAHLEITPAPFLAADESVPAENITFSAATDTGTKPIVTSAEKIRKPDYKAENKLDPMAPEAVSIPARKYIHPQIKDNPNKIDEPVVKKPVHKLAKAGFLLSLAGVLLHLIALPITGIGGGLLVLAAVCAAMGSIIGISGYKRIKDNPAQYAGKGFAIAGFLIGLLQILFYATIILAFMWIGGNLAG